MKTVTPKIWDLVSKLNMSVLNIELYKHIYELRITIYNELDKK